MKKDFEDECIAVLETVEQFCKHFPDETISIEDRIKNGQVKMCDNHVTVHKRSGLSMSYPKNRLSQIPPNDIVDITNK
jgi:hypothetical protein